MKKLSLFLLVSVFAFCGCSDENDEVKGVVMIIKEEKMRKKKWLSASKTN